MTTAAANSVRLFYTLDRRGRDESDASDTATYATDRECEDVAAVVDAVGEPAHLFGNPAVHLERLLLVLVVAVFPLLTVECEVRDLTPFDFVMRGDGLLRCVEPSGAKEWVGDGLRDVLDHRLKR